jgi:hypothetical protein
MRKLGMFAFTLGAVWVGFGACGGDSSTGNPDGSGDGTLCFGTNCNPFGDGTTGGDGKACTNLCLKQVNCGGGAHTTVSGTVYDPRGDLPLYNVAVYVPNAPLAPIVHGATCDQCGSTLSGDPLVSTLTDAAGHFVLKDVPVDNNVPLVIQVGKWRRRVRINTVTACVDNPLPGNTLTRLATKPGETSPDDDIPQIAVTTGGADALECLLPLIGVDSGQFTSKGAGGRVNLYNGSGGSQLSGGSPPVDPFWSDVTQLKAYDILMLSCEGATPDSNGEIATGKETQAVFDYGNAGGRVFATHFHYYWIESGITPWPTTATFKHSGYPNMATGIIDQTFPKGMAFAQWMLNVTGSTVLGQFPIVEPRNDVVAVNNQPPTNPVSIQWVYTTNPDPKMVEYYSFNTPVGLATAMQCGKVVFSDLHVGAGNSPGGTFPGQTCTQGPTLTPQEKALVFLLFDLSSCIQNDTKPPPPPVN